MVDAAVTGVVEDESMAGDEAVAYAGVNECRPQHMYSSNRLRQCRLRRSRSLLLCISITKPVQRGV
jgi:hypothetical protein